MNFILLSRLWVMVFLHYFVWGAWYVTMGTYTSAKLGFLGGQVEVGWSSWGGSLSFPLRSLFAQFVVPSYNTFMI